MNHNGQIRRRLAPISAGIVGLGITASVFAGGVANAAPAPAPVPGTNCSVMQVERALAHEDPALWQKISSHPRAKQRFESMITMTPEQRKARHQEMMAKHPERAKIREFLKDHNIMLPGRARQEMKDAHAAVEKAKQTCTAF